MIGVWVGVWNIETQHEGPIDIVNLAELEERARPAMEQGAFGYIQPPSDASERDASGP